jgi:hypothetical protein
LAPLRGALRADAALALIFVVAALLGLQPTI